MPQPSAQIGQLNVFTALAESLNGPAIRMTADDDMGDLETFQGELQSGYFRLIRGAGFREVRGSDKISRVADDKEITRFRGSENINRHPAIRTGYKKNIRALPERQLSESIFNRVSADLMKLYNPFN